MTYLAEADVRGAHIDMEAADDVEEQ